MPAPETAGNLLGTFRIPLVKKYGESDYAIRSEGLAMDSFIPGLTILNGILYSPVAQLVVASDC